MFIRLFVEPPNLHIICAALHGYCCIRLCSTRTLGLPRWRYHFLDFFVGIQVPVDVCVRHTS